MFTGTMIVAPVAAGAKSAVNYGSMRNKTTNVMHADCVFQCDENGDSYTYCDCSGSDD